MFLWPLCLPSLYSLARSWWGSAGVCGKYHPCFWFHCILAVRPFTHIRRNNQWISTLRAAAAAVIKRNQNKSVHIPVSPTTMWFCFSLWWIIILNAQLLLSVTSASSFLFHLPLTLRGNCRGRGSHSASNASVTKKPSARRSLVGFCACVWALGRYMPSPPPPVTGCKGKRTSEEFSPVTGGPLITLNQETMQAHNAWTQMHPQL